MEQTKWKETSGKTLVALLIIALLLKAISLSPFFVEKYYSSGFYPILSRVVRFMTGWVPISLGDLLYGFCVIWIAIRVYKTSTATIRRQVTKASFIGSLKRTVKIVLVIYIVFNVLWGLNYNRLGIAYELDLHPSTYSIDDLEELTSDLIIRVNETRRQMDSVVNYDSNREIFKTAAGGYDRLSKELPFLFYSNAAVKSSLYGFIGNYLGFLGYYNPFTAEAQVNVNVPRFMIPYTTCHEMAHQLGYADEDEANFVGYLAAKSSADNRFRYSVYFNLFAYANREVYLYDSVTARRNYLALDTLVRRDVQDYRKFLLEHRNVIEPFITLLYGDFLKANNQPKGIETYDQVVSWLIEYKKKFRTL